jgi:hypothetical protein
VHDNTQRAPAALACVTRNAQFTFQIFFRLTRFTVHDATQRAPAALACVTRNAQFTFKTFLRLTRFMVHGHKKCTVYLSNIFKIDTIHGVRWYAARACGACLCHKEWIYFAFQLFFGDYISGFRNVIILIRFGSFRFTNISFRSVSFHDLIIFLTFRFVSRSYNFFNVPFRFVSEKYRFVS